MSSKVVTKATNAIRARFPDAVVRSERGASPGRYALLVMSDSFRRKNSYRRQTLVWDVLDEALTREEFLKISFVYPVAPSEVKDEEIFQAGGGTP